MKNGNLRIKENRETFFKRFAGIDSNDLFLLEFAYDMAKEAHGYMKQVRFEHVRSVAIILVDEFGVKDINIIIPALFHDMPKNTFIWKVAGRITHIFGKEIGERSHVLAKPDKVKFRNDKEKMLRFYFNQIELSGPKTCLIEVADRIHNLRSMVSGRWDVDRMEIYCQETNLYFPDVITVIEGYESHLALLAKKKLDAEMKMA